MARNLEQIDKQIADLQRQREKVLESEVNGVVERIKVAIAHYRLSPERLFGDSGNGLETFGTTEKNSSKPTAKFADVNGNVWSGRGPRPHWLRDALAAGASLADFELGDSTQSESASTPAANAAPKSTRKIKAKAKRAPSKVLYVDGAGNTWTGRGPRPAWLKAQLIAGKELADLVQK